MAKQETKVKSKPKPKKVVSTSAIFKQKKPAAPEGKSKASHTKPSKTAAACSNKNARQTRASDRKRREEHPLSVAFSGEHLKRPILHHASLTFTPSRLHRRIAWKHPSKDFCIH